MGITIVQKSNLNEKKLKAKKALILAGGAVTGGSFKAGGIKALNDYFTNFRVNDFDIYVGISSGSFIAASLIGGLSPEEMLRSLDGSSRYFSKLSPWHLYKINMREIITKPLQFFYKCMTYLPGAVLNFMTALPTSKSELREAFLNFIKQPSAASYDSLMQMLAEVSTKSGNVPSWFHILPSGIFDNSPIEKYIRENIKKNDLTNSFEEAKRLSGKSLYVIAMTLDGAERVVFGPDERNEVTISEAIQASTAMPGFYKPARINGVDYVDGGIQQTANIDVAVEKGAKLIVCYNPFRPFDKSIFHEFLDKEKRYVSQDQRLSDAGVMAVLNQIFRTFFHSRLHFAIEHYQNDASFDGDIILIEPKADDVAFFELNPLAFGKRQRAALLGFESVRKSINEKFDEVSAILASYGITMDKGCVEDEHNKMAHIEGDSEIMDILKASKKSKKQDGKAKHKKKKR